MHPLITAHLRRANLECDGILWFDGRAEYLRRLDSINAWINELEGARP